MDPIIVSNILESLRDCIIVLGKEGEVLYANRFTEDVLGFPTEDFREKGLGLLFFLNDENFAFNQIFVNAIQERRVHDYSEVDYHHPDGRIRRLAATTSYLIASDGNQEDFIGFVAMFKDVTEMFDLREREKTLLLENHKIAKERIESLHKLAMGVAHELRNPLVTIGGFSRRISNDENNPIQTRQFAQSIIEQTERLETLVFKVQDYCNLPRARLRKGDIGEVVASAVTVMEQKGRENNVDIVFENRITGRRFVPLDRVQMRLALSNLLENAVKFSPENSTVVVTLYMSNGKDVVCDIQDSGPGIADEDKGYLFDPFFSTTTRGPGMGLAIVDRVVKEHHGKVEVHSAQGEGTLMRLVVPSYE